MSARRVHAPASTQTGGRDDSPEAAAATATSVLDIPEALVDADAAAAPETEYTDVEVSTEVEVEDTGFQPVVALGHARTFLTTTTPGQGIIAVVLLGLAYAGFQAVARAREATQTPQALRSKLVARNKKVVEELCKLLPGSRGQLSDATIKGLCRQTGFTPVEVFRKYLWYALRERKFNQDAVDDIVALKVAAALNDEQVAEALGERAQRIYDEYGTLMVNTEGFSTGGLARKAACKALCQKVLYLTELDALVAEGSEAAKRINLRVIFGATDADLASMRITTLEEVDLEAAFIKDTDGVEGLARQLTAAPLGFNKAFPQATTAASFAKVAHDALNLDAMLSPEEQAIRKRVRAYMEKEVAPVIADFWDRAEFPHDLLPGFAKLRLSGGSIQGYGCSGFTLMESAMAVIEVARVDCSMSTFLLVHSYLAMLTIGLLGSEEQKQDLLPSLARCETVGCWALTEPAYGSDASSLTTTATKVPGGWMIDGAKRWIGNGTFADITVVWARNNETNEVNAFIVKKGTPGFKATKIENKIALRCVQNADMTFERCFVPDAARLTGVDSFKDCNKVLAISRVMVAWQPVGACMGVYDMCARYIQVPVFLLLW
ncbi:hypothetical protein FOA52_015613 [Chlamydomonas sp. UWO 241]|nr:hypothetical protein FOA52_015613 [Chlamydomonas sp. UWO 241]